MFDRIEKVFKNNNILLSDVEKTDDSYFRTIRFCTPEGEDICETIEYNGTAKNFADKFFELAENFDAEAHTEGLIPLRGTNGVPDSIRDLLCDADWIKDTLMEVSEELDNAIEFATPRLFCYEISLVNYDENNLPYVSEKVYCLSTESLITETVEEFCRDALNKDFEEIFSMDEVDPSEYLDSGDSLIFFG